MTKITDKMSIMDAMIALAEGNPGAITAMSTMLKYFESSFPEVIVTSAFQEMLQTLDKSGIYGPDIWVIWKDECGFNEREFMGAMIREQDKLKVNG